MQVSGIDHVNILTHDLEGSAAFYETVLGLVRDENLGVAPGFKGAWMRDAAGHAIVHLVWKDPASDRYEAYEPGSPTNAVHHVALRCKGFAAMRDTLDRLGIVSRVNDNTRASVRQIFVTDPNAVNLELNFAGD